MMSRRADGDWFWMRATLSDASEHAFAVTNDAARDHHLAHVAPRAFRRWLRRHVLRFEFARDGDDAEVLLRTKGGQRSAGQHFVLGEPPAFSARVPASRRRVAPSSPDEHSMGLESKVADLVVVGQSQISCCVIVICGWGRLGE